MSAEKAAAGGERLESSPCKTKQIHTSTKSVPTLAAAVAPTTHLEALGSPYRGSDGSLASSGCEGLRQGWKEGGSEHNESSGRGRRQ